MDNIFKLDFRKNGKLSVDDSILIDKIAPIVLREYNDFTGRFIKANKLTGLSLLLAATCRNTLASPVFDVFCKAALLEEKLINGKVPAIIHVDEETKGVIDGVLEKFSLKGKVKVKSWKRNGTGIFIHIIINICKAVYYLISGWLWARYFRLKKKPEDSINYVDSFLFIDCINEEGKYVDHYYRGHDRYLSQEGMQREWLAPTLFAINYPSDYIKLGKRLKKKDQNFLIQEAWLTIFDCTYSFFAALVIPFSARKHVSFRGIDTKSLMGKVIQRDIGSTALMRAVLKFRFIRRLSLSGINICNAVDWNENQVIDRALNMAFRKFYPDLIVNGYQGFPVSEYYASLQPVFYEMDLNILPHQLHVIGEIYKQSKLKMFEKLDVKVAPAFRYSYLFINKDKRPIGNPIVLIALPGPIEECRLILQTCASLKKKFFNEVRFFLKIHPVYTKKRFFSLVPEFDIALFEVTSMPMQELFEIISVLITAGSSVAVEAVSIGIPVAICGNRSGVTHNFIPETALKKLWSVVYTVKDLETFVRESFNIKNRESRVHEFFQPMDKKKTRELFTCR
jgi:hypothetical protein